MSMEKFWDPSLPFYIVKYAGDTFHFGLDTDTPMPFLTEEEAQEWASARALECWGPEAHRYRNRYTVHQVVPKISEALNPVEEFQPKVWKLESYYQYQRTIAIGHVDAISYRVVAMDHDGGVTLAWSPARGGGEIILRHEDPDAVSYYTEVEAPE